MKRPMFAVGLVILAATAAAFFLPSWCYLLLLFAGVVGAGALSLCHSTRQWVPLPLAAVLALSVFMLHTAALQAPAQALNGTKGMFTGTVLQSQVKSYGTKYLVRGEASHYPGARLTIYLYAWEEQEAQLGDIITAEVQYRSNIDTTPSGDGIFLTASANHIQRVDAKLTGTAAMARARAAILAQIDHNLRGEAREIVKSVLLGANDEMSPNTMALFRGSGAAHVLVVSGLHISLFVSGTLWFLCRFMRPQQAALLAIPVLFFVSALEGYGVAVVRAAVMALLLLLSKATGCEYDGLSAWGTAVVVVLLWHPWAVARISFYMSFGAVLGILLFAQPLFDLMQYWRKKREWENPISRILWRIGQTIAVSLAAQVFLFPVFVLFFHQVPLLAPLASIAALPLLTPIMVVSILALVCSVLPGEISAVLAHWLWGGTSLLCRCMLTILEKISSLPFSVLVTDHIYLLVWYTAVLLLLGGILLVRPQDKNRKLLLCGAMCILCLQVGAISYQIMYHNAVQISRTDHAVVVTRGEGAAVLGTVPNTWEAEEIIQILKVRRVSSLELLFLRGKDEENSGVAVLSELYAAKLTVLPSNSLLTEVLPHDSNIYFPEKGFSLDLLGNIEVIAPQGIYGKITIQIIE